MAESKPSPIESQGGSPVFATTRWTLVLQAGQNGTPESAVALETLCKTYWPPLYAFARRRGKTPHEAQDLVQEFIARLLERRDLDQVHPDKGKFRSFLLASMTHFLANDWERSQRIKRGGGKSILSLEALLEQGVEHFEPASQDSPERAFDRQWAQTVLQHSLEQLRVEWEQRYQASHFDEFKKFLLEARGESPFAQVAQKVGITESALKSIVHRLRKRFRELFREQIANTVTDASEVDQEIRYLLQSLTD